MDEREQLDGGATDGRGAERLSEYLAAFCERLRSALWLRAAALLALLALMVTLGGSWLAIHTGFGAGTLALVRAVLLLVLIGAALALLVRPLRRLDRARAAAVEALAHDFDGRLRTFAQLPPAHPFRELLAQDALGIAGRNPPRGHISAARLVVPGGIAAALAVTLLWLAMLGPGLYRDGARAIWVGWLLPHLRPAQRLEVDPGDQAVRRGADVTVRSRAEGFDPAGARLYARLGNGAWQAIDMPREQQARGTASPGFAFTFFALRDPVSYYVAAAGIRSPTYQLSVVDVPNVDGLRLTYHYPDWTGRPPTTQQGNGDISAIAGTRVTLQLHTDRPLAEGELVLDAAGTPLAAHGNEASGALIVSRDARYYLAARIGPQRVRLTDDYLIKVLPVPAPQVHVTWPGRDYSASRIEEVTTEVRASDDYGLRALELHYSVNGGAWRTISLPLNARDAPANSREVTDQHVFALESLRPDHEPRALAPGDLVSYYAVARGHTMSTQGDLYFIDVQPFDRRYSQSQTAGGGGGGNEQDEISQRQREILVSTWNLLRRREQAASDPPASIHDNSTLLSTLQGKLAAQAQSLAARTQARQLMSSDPRIGRFIDSMRQAAKAMQPAAARLAATELDAAIAPEQQALQYLMRAASQFTDVQVAMQRGGGGNSAQSGRDLAQIYQLEMDLHKNQYESGSDASPESRDQQADALARGLQSLAQREQQLADQLRSPQAPTPEQRWQQQSLQREAEDLRQQLAQQQQQQQQQQNGAQGSSGGSSGQGTAGRSAASGGGAPSDLASVRNAATGGASGAANQPGGSTPSVGQQSGDSSNDLLSQRLDAAVRAMRQATAAMGTDAAGVSEQARQAAQQAAHQAQQSLSGAGTALARQRAQAMQQEIAQLAERAGQLHDQQAATQQQLQAALRAGAAGAAAPTGSPLGPGSPAALAGRMAQSANAPTPGGDPLSAAQRAQLTEQKRELSTGVQRLGDQVAAAAGHYRRDAPATSAALGQAAQVLSDTDLVDHLDIAAQYINEGAAGYIAPQESAVTDALRELHTRLQSAQAAAGQAVMAANNAPADPVTDELARLRALRGELQQVANAAQTGGTAATTATATATGAARGAGSRVGAAGRAAPGGGLGALDGGRRQVAAGAAALVPLLRAQGADAQSLERIDRLARELGEGGRSTRERQLAEQLRGQIALLDQLELQLTRRGQSPQAIRAAIASLGAERYQDAVAQYYRQLSSQ